ncbi:hypothetical protein BD779DRAFT_1806525 [Infundibulicybe gibba]|nr:hypothetical protein BD779DRAFT_1806525 [Infundibulicybe gibba]
MSLSIPYPHSTPTEIVTSTHEADPAGVQSRADDETCRGIAVLQVLKSSPAPYRIHAHQVLISDPLPAQRFLQRVVLAAAPGTPNLGRKPPLTLLASDHGHAELDRSLSHLDLVVSLTSPSPRTAYRSKNLHHYVPPAAPAPSRECPVSPELELRLSRCPHHIHFLALHSDSSAHSLLSHIRKTIAALLASPQVRKTWYKAGASIMQRGYVRGGKEDEEGDKEGDDDDKEEGGFVLRVRTGTEVLGEQEHEIMRGGG